MCPPMAEGTKELWVRGCLSYKGPNHLPKTSPPKTIILGVGSQYMKPGGGGHKHPDHGIFPLQVLLKVLFSLHLSLGWDLTMCSSGLPYPRLHYPPPLAFRSVQGLRILAMDCFPKGCLETMSKASTSPTGPNSSTNVPSVLGLQ